MHSRFRKCRIFPVQNPPLRKNLRTTNPPPSVFSTSSVAESTTPDQSGLRMAERDICRYGQDGGRHGDRGGPTREGIPHSKIDSSHGQYTPILRDSTPPPSSPFPHQQRSDRSARSSYPPHPFSPLGVTGFRHCRCCCLGLVYLVDLIYCCFRLLFLVVICSVVLVAVCLVVIGVAVVYWLVVVYLAFSIAISLPLCLVVWIVMAPIYEPCAVRRT